MSWDLSLEQHCNQLVGQICASGAPRAEREAAWQALLVGIAPHVEAWGKRSRFLRRMGMNGADDLRAVLVEVIARLRERDFANLRDYLARQEADTAAIAEEWATAHRLTRAVAPVDDEAVTGPDAADDDADGATGTPLQGWMINLTRYAMMNHVRRRLGYRAPRPDGERAPPRDAACGAVPLDAVRDVGERPPLTDLLAMRGALQEIRAFLAGLPPPMGDAVWLWCEEVALDDIAARLGLEDATAARNLVRAGNARLRQRFRHRWPELFPRAA